MSPETNAARKPRFDPTVNLGHVMTFLGFMLAGIGAYYGARMELSAIGLRIGVVERQIDKLATILVTDARQDERMSQIERRVERIEREQSR